MDPTGFAQSASTIVGVLRAVARPRNKRAGPFRAGGATFAVVARTARRVAGGGVMDVDVGVGCRGAYPGKTAGLRIDVAEWLRGGSTAFSVVYRP